MTKTLPILASSDMKRNALILPKEAQQPASRTANRTNTDMN